MKPYFLFLFLLQFASSSYSQRTIVFKVENNKTVSSDSLKSATELRDMGFIAGESLSIVVKNPTNKNFTLELRHGINNALTFSKNDFDNANSSVVSDSQLLFKKGNDSLKIIAGSYKLSVKVEDVTTILTLVTSVKPKGADSPDKKTPDTASHHPGIAYYDAVALGFDNKVTEHEFIDIVRFYFGDTIDQIGEAKAALKTNPFTKEIDTSSIKFKPAKAGAQAGIFGNLISSIGSIGGLDVTNVANGIAQFMIKRAKEELTVAFFNRFKEFAEKNEEFKVLFPKTTDNLSNLLDYKYPDMLPALRTGFFEDLKAITYHLDDVLELPRYQELLKNFPEIRVAIRSIRLIHEIEAGDADAATVIKKFAEFKEWKDETASTGFKNFGNSVRLASIFSNSLRNNLEMSNDSSRAWITFKQMDTLIRNEKIFMIYAGLVYQLVKKESIRFYIAGGNVREFKTILEEQKENLFLFQNKVNEFVELANKVDKTLDTLKEKKRNDIELTNDDYYVYIDVSLDVIDYGFSIAKLFDDNIKTDEYIKIARKANELYRNIYKAEYTQAVSNAIDILETVSDMVDENRGTLLADLHKIDTRPTVFEKQFDDLNDADIVIIKNYLDSLIKAGGTTVIDGSLRKLVNKVIALYYSKDFSKLADVISSLTRYGLFIANLADAKSPDEVEAILDNAVLPVGSSSIKKNSRFNLAIQSYLGVYYRVNKFEQDNNDMWSSHWGVTAPIGVAASWGFPRKAGSLSLFASLLDLGAIVDYQLKKDSIATPAGGNEEIVAIDYEIKLGQIFSPGLYLIYGCFNNIPLSFGIGGQYGPGLGKIETDGNDVVNNPRWRFNIFLAVDIPFFNLVNSSKKYKP